MYRLIVLFSRPDKNGPFSRLLPSEVEFCTAPDWDNGIMVMLIVSLLPLNIDGAARNNHLHIPRAIPFRLDLVPLPCTNWMNTSLPTTAKHNSPKISTRVIFLRILIFDAAICSLPVNLSASALTPWAARSRGRNFPAWLLYFAIKHALPAWLSASTAACSRPRAMESELCSSR